MHAPREDIHGVAIGPSLQKILSIAPCAWRDDEAQGGKQQRRDVGASAVGEAAGFRTGRGRGGVGAADRTNSRGSYHGGNGGKRKVA